MDESKKEDRYEDAKKFVLIYFMCNTMFIRRFLVPGD